MAIINNGFILSANIKVFPCAYRGTNIDPEARVNSEYNFTHIQATVDKKSYIIGWEKDATTSKHTFKFILGGYYFELINLTDGDKSEIENYKYIYAKISSDATAEIKSPVLVDYSTGKIGTLDSNDYFMGVKFSTNELTDANFTLDISKNSDDWYPIRATKVLSANGKSLVTNLADGTKSSTVILNNGTTKSDQVNLVAFGKYNTSTSGNLFEIGNGTSDTARSNILEVSASTVTAANNLTVSETEVVIDKDLKLSNMSSTSASAGIVTVDTTNKLNKLACISENKFLKADGTWAAIDTGRFIQTTEGNNFATWSNLINAASFKIFGGEGTISKAELLKNDYAIVEADEEHDKKKTKYLWTADGESGSWQYAETLSSDNQTVCVGDTTFSAGAAVNFEGSGGISIAGNSTDNKITISSKAAAENELGAIKLGYATSDKKYAVELDSTSKAFVNVPWESTTYEASTNINIIDGKISVQNTPEFTGGDEATYPVIIGNTLEKNEKKHTLALGSPTKKYYIGRDSRGHADSGCLKIYGVEAETTSATEEPKTPVCIIDSDGSLITKGQVDLGTDATDITTGTTRSAVKISKSEQTTEILGKFVQSNNTNKDQATFNGNIDANNGLDIIEGNLTVGTDKFKVDTSGKISATGNIIVGSLQTKTTLGINASAFGNNVTASGKYSHAEGLGTIAKGRSQHVFGEYNIRDLTENNVANRGEFIEIVGNGTSNDSRSNARTLDWDGNEWLAGNLTLKSGSGSFTTTAGSPHTINLGQSSMSGDNGKLNIYYLQSADETECLSVIDNSSTSSTFFKVTNKGNVTATSYNATSDKRLKENIAEYKSEKSILDLPIYKYDFINGSKNQIGCLAQDLQEICPEIVKEDENGYLSIQESKIVYLLLDEVKKLKEEINKLKRGD